MEMSGIENAKGTVFIPMYDKEMGFLKKYLKTLYLLFFHPIRFFSKGIFDVKIWKAAYFFAITVFIGVSLYFIIHEPSMFAHGIKITDFLILVIGVGLVLLFCVLVYMVLSFVYYLALIVVSGGKAAVSFRKTFNILSYSSCFLLFTPILTTTTLTWYAVTKIALYLFPAIYRYLGFSIVYKIKFWRLFIIAMIEMTLFFGSVYLYVVGQNEFLKSFGPRHQTQLIFEADTNHSDFSGEAVKEMLNQISRVMKMRLEKYGIKPKIAIDYGNRQLKVSYFGPEQAKKYLLDPGIFQWRIVLDVSQDRESFLKSAEGKGDAEIFSGSSKKIWYLLSNQVVLDNFDVSSARRSTDQFGSPMIAITLNKQGVAKFSATTTENLKKRLAVIYNGVVLSAPSITEPIKTPYIVITGNYTEPEAEYLAGILNSSTYIVPIKLLKETISPQPK